MISRVYSFVLQGIDAVRCEIEADLTSPGTRKTEIVGLPEAAVNESINLAPAHLRKEGAVCDLPIAVLGLNALVYDAEPGPISGVGSTLMSLRWSNLQAPGGNRGRRQLHRCSRPQDHQIHPSGQEAQENLKRSQHHQS